MKNTFIIIIVLVLVAGALFLFGMRKKAEAPALGEGSEESGVVSGTMPTLDAPGTEETIVTEESTVNIYQSPVTTPTNTKAKEFTVSGQNFSFTPSLITVAKGDKVKITFKNTSGFHDFRIDEFDVATKQSQSPATEVLEFTADKIGSFEYYCSIGTHRAMGMKGTFKVE